MAEQPKGWTITEYVAANGETPMLTFLNGLAGRNKKDAIAVLQLLRELGGGTARECVLPGLLTREQDNGEGPGKVSEHGARLDR